MLSPNGQEKYESGDQMLIQWHQNGAFSKPADQAYQLTVANQLPVSYWRLGETSGTAAADSAGTRTGTYVGNPTLGLQAPSALG